MKKSPNIDGQRFGKWTVLETIPKYKNSHTYCKCLCDCGNTKIVAKYSLLNGDSKSCGCLARELSRKRYGKDRTGERFGKLIVTEMIYGDNRTKCKCICDCGNEIIARVSNLVSGSVKSCGCATSDLCWNGRRINLVGQHFGEWTVLEMLYNYNNSTQTYCKCVCSCGTIKYVYAGNLLKHLSTSCGCQSTSIGEKIIYDILENHNIDFLQQYTFDDCVDKHKLPFDFYLPRHNICIEYQGIQHYKPIKFFGGEEAFIERKHHDNIKQEYCILNNINLLCIPYTLNKNDIEDYLLNVLNP